VGDIEIAASGHTTVAMSDAPGSDPATMVSGFQTNTTFLRLDLHANWTVAGTVRVLDLAGGS
jgi:hypothetical protein